MNADHNKGLSDRITTLKGWVTGALTLLGAIVAAALNWEEHRAIVLYSTAGLAAVALLLWFWNVAREKKPQPVFGKQAEYRYNKTTRRAALVGLCIIPIGWLVVALRLVIPPIIPTPETPPIPPLDCSKLTVAVTGLLPASNSAADSEMAERVTTTLLDHLSLTGIAVLDRTTFTFKEERFEKRPQAAMRLALDEGAHFVVFGKMQANPSKALLSIACHRGCPRVAGNSGRPQVSLAAAEPSTIKFTEVEGNEAGQLADQLAGLAKFVMALWLYDQGDLDGALNKLRDIRVRDVDLVAANLYQGLIYWQRSEHSPNRKADLENARDRYEKVLGREFDAVLDQDSDIEAYTCVNAGNVFYELSAYDPENADAHLARSRHLFESVRQYCQFPGVEKSTSRALWTAASNGLGVAMIGQAHRQPPAGWRAAFQEVESLLSEALAQPLPSPDDINRDQTNRHLVESNLAGLLVELSRMEVDRGDKLKRARDLYDAVVKVIDRNAAPYEWAVVQANLGNACTELAIDSPPAEALSYLRDADEHYAAAGEVFTAGAYPVQCVQNQIDTTRVWIESARRKEGQEADDLLDRAVATCERVRRFPNSLPLDLALATRYLASAKREKGNKDVNPDTRRSVFNEAVSLLRGSLAKLDRHNDQFEWATTQRELGESLHALGLALSGTERQRYLLQAVAAYSQALNIWDSQTSAYDHRQTLISLGKARADLNN